jgi:hypothetical protein
MTLYPTNLIPFQARMVFGLLFNSGPRMCIIAVLFVQSLATCRLRGEFGHLLPRLHCVLGSVGDEVVVEVR